MKRVSEFTSSKKYEINLSNNLIYNDKNIQEFIILENISDEIFKNQYKTFYDFYVMKSNPEIFNIDPFLVYIDGIVEIKYKESEEEIIQREARKLKNVVKTAYISNSVLNANFLNLYGDNKENLAKHIIENITKYLSGKESKGSYIYGKTGIGKTYVMGALYNYLKDRGKEPAIIFFPEFIRRVKSEISTGNYNAIIDEIRAQEILIIDDLGAENITDFVRDEVLVPIINYRSDENLLTFITSNLGIEELTSFLSTTKESKDETKAIRLLRRILGLTDPYYLDS